MPVQPFSPNNFFETSKQTAEGPAELQAFVSRACSLRFCTLYLHLHHPAYARFSGDPTIGQQRKAQGRQSASQPTTAHRLILPPSPDPVVGLGSPTTDARVPNVRFGAGFLGGFLGGDRRIKIGNTNFRVSQGCSFCCLGSPSAAQHTTIQLHPRLHSYSTSGPDLVIDDQDATHYNYCHYRHQQGPRKTLHGASQAVHN